MKRTVYIILTLAALSVLSSCDDFMDVHKDFIKDGEIIYSPKVDSVSFVAGEHRILFHCWLYNSPNVRSVDLYWNERRDSLITAVTPSMGRDSVDILLSGLEEKSYTFDVRTTDQFGHKSLWTTDFGNTYGANYRATLADRRINEISLEEKDGVPRGKVTFFSGSTLLVRNEVRYVRNDGSRAIATLPSDGQELYCDGVKPGTSFETRSFYIPEEEAIDTFATEWALNETAFPLIYVFDRSKWTVLDVSDETASDGGGMHAVIDGNTGSYWHSRWDGGNVPLPHWLTIDLGAEINTADIVRFDLYRRPGNTDTKTVGIYLGNSPNPDGAWTKVAETVVNADKMEVAPSNRTVRGRYLKLVFPDSNRDPFTNLAEIYIYGGGM
ncbi:MAG: discoidin domain-containing protein [Tannerella sp.]|jgi:hypothetical protein|nr:discoidin domain-containing protein [Tannerella sp.]